MSLAIILDNYKEAKTILASVQSNDVLFELRLDKDFELLHLITEGVLLNKQVILTLRSKTEGGDFIGKDRLTKLKELIDKQPKYLDLEYSEDHESLIEFIKLNKSQIIVSRHDYLGSFEQRAKYFRDEILRTDLIQYNNQFILKFVGKPIDTVDWIKGFRVLTKEFPRHIILGIGENSTISRTLSRYLQQELVFAATKPGGILQYNDLIPSIEKADYLKIGLIGRSLSHSFSPQIHGFLLKDTGLDGYYHVLEVRSLHRLANLLDFLKQSQFKGCNVTFPYKSSILQLADKMSENCLLANATNTLIIKKNSIVAENTDISGFTQFLKNQKLDKYSSAVIFGAGGASRAVTIALLQNDFEVTIVNRSVERKKEFNPDLLEQINFMPIKEYNVKHNSEIYINATPIGLIDSKHHLIPFPSGIEVAIDLVYSPTKTKLQILADKNGIQNFDGKEMLLHQAADAFELWSGMHVDRDKLVLYNEEYI
ncbi:MAG: shikimate dehydrogenase [Candidatus Kariarchaeaceae archaeon]|jgi:shikimate dehydrogenase